MKERIQEHWNKISPQYRMNYLSHQNEEIDLMKNLFREYLPNGNTLRVLDVGTGLGIQAIIFAELGHIVTALDISEEMLKRAKQNAAEKDLTITFVQGDAENLPFESDEFDVIVTQHVLWTLTDHKKFFGECRRVLKSHGRIFAIDGHWFKGSAPDETHCPKDIVQFLPLGSGNTPEKIFELVKTAEFDETEWKYLQKYADYMKKYDPQSYIENNSSAVPYLVTGVKA